MILLMYSVFGLVSFSSSSELSSSSLSGWASYSSVNPNGLPLAMSSVNLFSLSYAGVFFTGSIRFGPDGLSTFKIIVEW